MKYAILLTGSAGAGKTTLAAYLANHYQIIHKTIYIINMDPAVQYLPFKPSADIRDLVTSDDIQQYLLLGPNASLIYAVEHFIDNELEAQQEFFDYDEDFLLIDCPGQIETLLQFNSFQKLAKKLQTLGYQVGTIYCTESQKIVNKQDFLSNALIAAAVRASLGIAFLQVYTKCDLTDLWQIDEEFEFENQFEKKLTEVIGGNQNAFVSVQNEDTIGILAEMIDFMMHIDEE
ncbi:ATP-binding protein [Spironucleus salmonicida]|uniref:GPN-loop GTPase 3 n=1 Tax=Spironucleus salmonicida TaxID=348837 RepID=V6LPP7_9EUKA|nr:ATP-binding protein [Spironucleus salmonicida]KAH0573531.1 ATP-binding protein [Spironucleus salmonicida]|eukprot:EST46203.1 ATP-binding protein [Spironucleus salmonicida]